MPAQSEEETNVKTKALRPWGDLETQIQILPRAAPVIRATLPCKPAILEVWSAGLQSVKHSSSGAACIGSNAKRRRPSTAQN